MKTVNLFQGESNFSSRPMSPAGGGIKGGGSLLSTHAVQVMIFLSFEGQKKQKPIFSHKAAGAIQPHTKSKTHGLRFTEG